MTADSKQAVRALLCRVSQSLLLVVATAFALPALSQNAVNRASVAPPTGVTNTGTSCNNPGQISSSKSSDPATGTTVNPGATITYTLSTTVTTAALTAVYTLTDTISGDQTFGSVTNAGSYTCTGTGPLACTLPAGTLPGTYTLTYTTTVDADAAGTVGNSVTGTGGGDPDPECTNCTTTHTVAAPVISSSKSSDPATGATVNPGATITYIRQALRLYQVVEDRADKGKKMFFVDNSTKERSELMLL